MNNKEIAMRMAAMDNLYSYEGTLEDVDVDDSPFLESDLVETQEPVENFTKSEAVARQHGVSMFTREDFQVRKGLQRGKLFVFDFGNERLVAFTGEGVILDN